MKNVTQSPENLEIDQLLADGDQSGVSESKAESTVDKLRAELDTIATHLKQPVSPEPFQDEPACARAVELASNVGRQAPVNSIQVKAGIVIDNPSELGEVGPYKLLKLLGQGGMGAVYKALHPRLDKVVALKVLHAGRIKDEGLDRFQREMKALGKLDHPHLIRALDAGDANGTHYLVMEFVEGTDLSALIAKRGKLPIADACELIVQAAMGLHAAHTRGMVHRDIKPANLMLAEQEFGPPIVKVLDLGLALLADSQTPDEGGLTSDGQIMGTIDYMPPEQAQDSHSVDIRADIYSLGATLYALLAGGSIFQGRPHKTSMQKLIALATEPIPSVRSHRPEVSEALAAIVHRMLARNPNERFASPAEVVAALKPFAVGANLSSLMADDSDQTVLIFNNSVELTKARAQVAHDASTKALEVVRPTLASPANSGRKRFPFVIATAVAGVVLLGAILFSLKTPNGEVIVEIPDDLAADVRKDIKISVTGDGAAEVASEANGWKIDIKEGKYSVELTGGSDRVQVEDKQVTVSRGKKAIVTITMKPTGAMAASGTKPAGGANSDPDRRAAEWILTINDGPAPDLFITIAGQITALKDRQLPTEPFHVSDFSLQGPIIDKFGDRLADELATKIKGIRVKQIRLASRTLTTAGFAKLVAMPEFSELNTLEVLCHDHDMDDGVFPLLAKLPDLNRLTIVASPATGAPNLTGKGIGELKACSRLGQINWLNSTPIPQAVEELSQLPKLYALGFNNIVCSERHTLALSKLKLLELAFYEAKVDDSMVKHLATMEKLQRLGLANNPITDKGLSELKGLKNLKTIELGLTKVTAAGVADFQQALPDCKIVWDYPDADRRAAEWLLSLHEGQANLLVEIVGGQITDAQNHKLPAVPFRVHTIFLSGPVIDRWGDRLADELAQKLGGIRVRGAYINSGTLTTAGFAKLVAMPEFSEASDINLNCNDRDMDDGVFPLLAKLSDLKKVVIVARPHLTGAGIGELKACSKLGVIIWQDGSPSSTAVEELAQLPKLDSLSFIAITCTDQHMMALAKLKVRDLHIHASKVDDGMLRHLATMEKLETLGIIHNPITDQGLSELKQIKTLKTLDIRGTKVTATGVADLQQALPNCKIEWDYSDPDRKLAEWLRSYDPELTFGGNFSNNTPFSVEVGQPIPNEPFTMNYINMVGKKVDEQGDAYLEELANHLQGVRLKGLMFATHSMTSRGMAKFLHHPELADCSTIAMNGQNMEDDVLAAISKLTKLTEVVFQTGPKLTGQGIGQLRELKELTGLTLLRTPGFTAEALEQLQTLPKLEVLNIDGFRFTEQHLAAITKFKLKQLLTNEAGIDDAMLARFAEMQTIEKLGFSNSPLTDAALPELKQLKGLVILHLFGTKVTAAGVADLQKALPNCKIEWDAPKE